MKLKPHSFAIPEHWKLARSIGKDFYKCICDTVTFSALKELCYRRTLDFIYEITELDDVESYIYVRLFRLRRYRDHVGATCSRHFNSIIDIYITDDMLAQGFRTVKSWVRSALFHEITHALQRRLSIAYSLPLAEQWDIGENTLNPAVVKHTQQTYQFLHMANYLEMDANLCEYWCTTGRVPASREEMYEGVYAQYDLPDMVLREVADFVWNYWFAGRKKAMLKRRLDIYKGKIQLYAHSKRRKVHGRRRAAKNV